LYVTHARPKTASCFAFAKLALTIVTLIMMG
jgi:hypothetical protein